MDERMENLDVKLRIEMSSELKKRQHEIGTKVVFVTHDQVKAVDEALGSEADERELTLAVVRLAWGQCPLLAAQPPTVRVRHRI